jgi:hypothetical protein
MQALASSLIATAAVHDGAGRVKQSQLDHSFACFPAKELLLQAIATSFAAARSSEVQRCSDNKHSNKSICIERW